MCSNDDRRKKENIMSAEAQESLDLLQEISQDSSLKAVNNEGLSTIAEFATAISAQELRVEELEEQLKEAKRELRSLTDEKLPQLLLELGVSEFKLEDGTKVTVKNIYGATIPAARREEAYQWLRDHGHGDMIKNVISASFGMGEDQLAQKFKDTAKENGLICEQKMSVHSQTLKGFVRGEIEKGRDVPQDLFGVFVSQRAVIKGDKK